MVHTRDLTNPVAHSSHLARHFHDPTSYIYTHTYTYNQQQSANLPPSSFVHTEVHSPNIPDRPSNRAAQRCVRVAPPPTKPARSSIPKCAVLSRHVANCQVTQRRCRGGGIARLPLPFHVVCHVMVAGI
ncbi:uncharacterized protein BO95DRAFT_68779 [Aspergillus brunneoviolaceus CBS 621.78]|uniref:Uncharacterized protein n=1 Tax=Aspergillus brunneoviolaceus CBS 621.78 TaxID=1450534 RepID=A0ACD1GFX1_9EURO|nr:hypothetical protein BO95DRAFT_68779 [Aspergillus brunneoviolaceus CBS 621.78]RAH48126.1 hypothetical protein BO95DRAFT_68779 [Aspergillus brunneoviolaceus CBS 621.78]